MVEFRQYVVRQSEYQSSPLEFESVSTFTAKVDWDVDENSTEGCHGTDLLDNDDPVELQFTVASNGDIFVEGFSKTYTAGLDRTQEYTYLLSNGKLYYNAFDPGVAFDKNDPSLMRLFSPVNNSSIPVSEEFGGHKETLSTHVLFRVDQDFVQCFGESSELNNELSDDQKAAVEAFFEASLTFLPTYYDRAYTREVSSL